MRKVGNLIKYELLELKRGKFLWIMGALYLIGTEQAISSMRPLRTNFFSLVSFIKVSWLPLNFIMIPLMLLSINIGKSNNDVFNIMDISHRQLILSKVLTLGIIDGIFLAMNIFIALAIGIINSVSMKYFLYESLGYFINTLIFLIVSTAIGLFIGNIIGKKLPDVINFMLAIIIFVLLCNFYKTSNLIVPLINIKNFPSTFDVISYDKAYLYHNMFWIIIAFIMFKVMFYGKLKNNIKSDLIHISALTLSGVLALSLVAGIFLNKPYFYDIVSRIDSRDRTGTFFAKEDCGYYVNKYYMDIDINNKLKNCCDMDIVIKDESIESLEFGLYKKLDTNHIELDGKEINFKRTNNSFIVKLPRTYKKGETVKVKLNYEGKVDTIWLQGIELFFVRNNTMFLADVFEWYPKLNDGIKKEYKINIKHSGSYNIYSNLEKENNLRQCKLEGEDSEVFLIAGDLSERKYKDYIFIGNEEFINNNKQCDMLIKGAKNNGLSENSKIVVGSFVPGGKKMDKNYEKAYLDTSDR